MSKLVKTNYILIESTLDQDVVAEGIIYKSLNDGRFKFKENGAIRTLGSGGSGSDAVWGDITGNISNQADLINLVSSESGQRLRFISSYDPGNLDFKENDVIEYNGSMYIATSDTTDLPPGSNWFEWPSSGSIPDNVLLADGSVPMSNDLDMARNNLRNIRSVYAPNETISSVLVSKSGQDVTIETTLDGSETISACIVNDVQYGVTNFVATGNPNEYILTCPDLEQMPLEDIDYLDLVDDNKRQSFRIYADYLDMRGSRIEDVGDPTENDHAANKGYVDSVAGGGGTPTGTPYTIPYFDEEGDLSSLDNWEYYREGYFYRYEETVNPMYELTSVWHDLSFDSNYDTNYVVADNLEVSISENSEKYNQLTLDRRRFTNISSIGSQSTTIRKDDLWMIPNDLSDAEGGHFNSYVTEGQVGNISNLNYNGMGSNVFFSETTSLQSVNIFFDRNNMSGTVSSYNSASFSPYIHELSDNYNGLLISGRVDTSLSGSNSSSIAVNQMIGELQTSSGYNGISISPTVENMEDGSWFNGLYISPSVTGARFLTNIQSSTNNIVVYPGEKSSVEFQDIRIETHQPDSGVNGLDIQIVSDTTAGNEYLEISLPSLIVHVEAGVTTLQTVVDTLNSNFTFAGTFGASVLSSPSNTIVVGGPYIFAGGESAGRAYAARFEGDVDIQGDLSFSGALAIGSLNAFAGKEIVNGTGNPDSVHMLISQPTVPDNTTVISGDMLGINTASLITIGENSSVTTMLTGIAALGLPAVLNMGNNSTIDKVSAAMFALSLDTQASGGHVEEVSLANSLLIPNGVTQVDKLIGYKFSTPFGHAGVSKVFGVYIDQADATNYFRNNLVVGDSEDAVNSDVAIEINSTKAFLNARMDETQRDGLDAVNGMQIYNTETHKLEVYANGVWVELN